VLLHKRCLRERGKEEMLGKGEGERFRRWADVTGERGFILS